jgi:hypothetical protein
MCDYVPAHFSRAVRDILNSTYHNRWIVIGRYPAWPSLSPDLNPLDLCLWGHLEPIVSSPPLYNKGTIHQPIVNACQTIIKYSGIFEHVRQSTIRRAQVCIESRFEHFLQMHRFSAVTGKEAVADTFLHELVPLFWYVELIPRVCSHISDSHFTLDSTTCAHLD